MLFVKVLPTAYLGTQALHSAVAPYGISCTLAIDWRMIDFVSIMASMDACTR